MLEVSEVHTYYGDSHVLNGVSLTVEPGQIHAVLGRNGVGKTTLINTIMGMLHPREGEIRYRGDRISGQPAHRVAQKGVALVPQGRRLFPSLTVEENLLIGHRNGSGSTAVWSLDRVFELFPQLEARAGHKADKLSGGEQQMVAMGRALMTGPSLLLLDEPTEGLAPLIVRRVGDVIQRLKDEEALAILLVEQKIAFALQHADHVYVMSRGAFVEEGHPSDLAANESIAHGYFGGRT